MTEKSKVPDILVEQLVLGELHPEKAHEVRQLLENEIGGLERLDAIEASNKEILSKYSPRVQAALIQNRRKNLEPIKNSFWGSIPALTSTATVILAIVLIFTIRSNFIDHKIIGPDQMIPIERIKGDSRLFIHLKTDDGSRELADGDQVQAGDRLQLSYMAADALYGVILSVDGKGSVTVHFPKNPNGSAKLSSNGVQSLDFSYELDEAPLFERFYFVTGENEIDIHSIIQTVKAYNKDDNTKAVVFPGLSFTDLTLIKKTGGQ